MFLEKKGKKIDTVTRFHTSILFDFKYLIQQTQALWALRSA